MKTVNLFGALFLFVIAASCSQEDSGDENPSPDKKQMVSKIVSSNGSESTYAYSGDRLTTIITTSTDGEVRTSTYTYTGEKVTKSESKTVLPSGTQDYVENTTYTYSGDRIVSSVNNNDGTIYNSTYDYDSNGNVLSQVEKYANGTINATYEWEYDGNNNMIKETVSYPGATEVYTYTYDNKNNILKHTTPMALQKILRIGKNNNTSTSGMDYQNSTVYEYNSYEFPTKRSFTSNGTTTVNTITYK